MILTSLSVSDCLGAPSLAGPALAAGMGASTTLTSLSLPMRKPMSLPSGTRRTSLSLLGLGGGDLGPPLLPPDLGPPADGSGKTSWPISTCSLSPPRENLKTPGSEDSAGLLGTGESCAV